MNIPSWAESKTLSVNELTVAITMSVWPFTTRVGWVIFPIGLP